MVRGCAGFCVLLQSMLWPALAATLARELLLLCMSVDSTTVELSCGVRESVLSGVTTRSLCSRYALAGHSPRAPLAVSDSVSHTTRILAYGIVSVHMCTRVV